MGIVYRARREDGRFDKDVAIKILHWGGHGSTLTRLFGQETRMLAALDHPGITRLLDRPTTTSTWISAKWFRLGHGIRTALPTCTTAVPGGQPCTGLALYLAQARTVWPKWLVTASLLTKFK